MKSCLEMFPLRYLSYTLSKYGENSIGFDNEKLSNKALVKCQELADKLNLEMKILTCDYTFNQNQLLFTAN